MNDKLLIDRATIAQALEAFRMCVPMDGKHAEVDAAFRNLRAALARQAEPVAAVAENATAQQRVVETPPSDYRRGYWDGFNIGKREGRIEAEDALAQQPEPAQEPVAWLRVIDEAMVTHHLGVADPADDYETAKRKMNELLCHAQDIGAYFAAPFQRPRLTDEEIDKATAQERDALLDHIYEYGTAAEGVLERIRRLARAVERKVRGE